jgi:DNA-binding protein H-NS
MSSEKDTEMTPEQIEETIRQLEEGIKEKTKTLTKLRKKKTRQSLNEARRIAASVGYACEFIQLSEGKKSAETPLETTEKLPPKYRNPKNPEQTWTGYGKHPVWLREALGRGEQLEDFAVQVNPEAPNAG